MFYALVSEVEDLAFKGIPKPDNNVFLRQLTETDTNILMDLMERCDWNENLSYLSNGTRKYIGAFSEDYLIGYISYTVEGQRNRKGKFLKPGLIVNLVVDPEYRKRGIGFRLVTEAEKDIKQSGIRLSYLHVRTTQEREAARSLYHKLGYKTIRTLPHYYKTGDAYEMQKIL